MHKVIQLIVISSVLLTAADLFAQQKVTINGYVRDKTTGEALIGAAVFDPVTLAGTSSNSYGYFSLTINAVDTTVIHASFVGYQRAIKKIPQGTDIRLDFYLDQTTELDAIEISAARNDDNVNRALTGTTSLSMKEIKSIPVLMDERDILKVIQFLPGVQQGQEGTTGFYVRGGNSDQNMVQLDEAVIYNPNHLFGLVSTFNVNALNSVKLIKGGFPSQYGGRLSSILDVTLKEGNKEKFQAEGGIGILAANLTLQGPIQKNKSSYIISKLLRYRGRFKLL